MSDPLINLSVKCIFHVESNTGSLDFSVEGYPSIQIDECDREQLAREAISLLTRYLEEIETHLSNE